MSVTALLVALRAVARKLPWLKTRTWFNDVQTRPPVLIKSTPMGSSCTRRVRQSARCQ